MVKKLLNLKQVCALLRRSKSSVYRDVKAGVFPAPIKTGRRATAWIESEIAEWQQRLMNQRRAYDRAAFNRTGRGRNPENQPPDDPQHDRTQGQAAVPPPG